MSSRRRVILLAVSLAAACFSTSQSIAQEVKIDDATKQATAKALAWLASRQEADGSWSEPAYPKNNAITAFAMLAFMSQGHLPARGPYGETMARGCRFLIKSARTRDGYLGGIGQGNMYCHAMATLALAELWGMSADENIKPVLTKAVDLIVRSQNSEGGWRYEPEPTGADISVTIMQVMALRAAKNSGLHVPDETLKKAIRYILKCYDPSSGGFRYMPGQREPGFARTAAGICVLQLSGAYDAQQIPKAVEFLRSNLEPREHFWYGHYYAAHALHQLGGKDWADYYAAVRGLLLSKQSDSGEWSTRSISDNRTAGPVYQTSIAVIILSVPAHYLPIFQR
jgi:prenyltransferase beta subunit